MKNLFTGMKPALLWLTISFILLAMPGSALPKEPSFLSIIPHFDKWVHVGMFTILVWLFCWGYYQKNYTPHKLRKIFFFIMLMAVLYGIAMEFFQREFVTNRSYDTMDILADLTGASLGFLLSWAAYIKK